MRRSARLAWGFGNPWIVPPSDIEAMSQSLDSRLTLKMDEGLRPGLNVGCRKARVGGGSKAQQSFEMAAHVALISEAHLQRHVAERPARGDQVARAHDPHV